MQHNTKKNHKLTHSIYDIRQTKLNTYIFYKTHFVHFTSSTIYNLLMLWVWAQFSEQSRFFVPSIDGAQLGEGGNVPDRCSFFKCDQTRALWFNHRSWEAQTGSIGPPWHFRAQIVWIQMVPRPKWSKSCFPNSLNGPHNRPMWIWNHQSPLFKADQDI